MISATEIAWAAGFFEGEGAIMLLSRGQSRTLCRLSVEVSQIDREPLDWLQERWGGRIYTYTRTSRAGHRNDYRRLILSTARAAAFLVDIQPYVIRPIVRQRIELALACQAQKTNTWENRTPEYHARQEDFVRQMAALNRRDDLTPLERAVLEQRR